MFRQGFLAAPFEGPGTHESSKDQKAVHDGGALPHVVGHVVDTATRCTRIVMVDSLQPLPLLFLHVSKRPAPKERL